MKTILVYSGKGGVGKTTTSANLAKTIAEMGKKVFVVDGDINTPSMEVIFKRPDPEKNIRVASTAFFQKGFIYIQQSTVRKFFKDTVKNIKEFNPDYVIIDTPPSITDVHINLMEIFEVSGIVIVTQPSDLSKADVARTATFFTEKCKEAGIVMVENMVYPDSPVSTYAWKLVEKIPFEKSFNGENVFNENKERYKNILNELLSMNIKESRYRASKNLMFDETITEDDLPTDTYGLTRNDLKFINVRTWDKVRELIMDSDRGWQADMRLIECNSEKVGRLVKAFEEDEQAYFMVSNAPNTEIDLIAGEIGLCSIAISDMYYGMPVVNYQTLHGNVTLFANEVIPMDLKNISIALKDGYIILKDGRYFPPKHLVEECYYSFGSRVGLHKNWEEKYDRIVSGKKREDEEEKTFEQSKLKVKTINKKQKHAKHEYGSCLDYNTLTGVKKGR